MIRNGHALAIADWDDAIAAASRALDGKRVVVFASPNLSNEALFLLERLVALSNGEGVFRVEMGSEFALPGAPDLALRAERGANATGARLLGFVQLSSSRLPLQEGDALLVVGEQLDGIDGSELDRASAIVHVGTTLPDVLAARVHVLLPMANIPEEEGTLTNLRGRVQRFMQAKAAPGVARPSWYVLADLLAAMGGEGRFFAPADVFDAMSATHAPFATLDYDALGLRGLPILSESPVTAEVGA